MKNYYLPYKLDMEYQRKTYVNVGMDIGDRKTADLGLFGNISRWRRKKKNKDEKRYKECNTYSEWKKYVESCIPSAEQCDKENFIHWLKMKKRHAESYHEGINNVLIPMYVALLSMLELFCPDDSIKIYIAVPVLLLVVGVSTVALRDAIEKIKFYEDFIEISEKN